jgi:hypothetical protein
VRAEHEERAEGYAGQDMLLRSAVAAHDADISSADVAEDSRTITADLPTRRHPRNAVINPAATGWIFTIPIEARSEEPTIHSQSLRLILIANNSQ